MVSTGSNNLKLIQHHRHYDLRKFDLTNRVIPIWNSLSTRVVSADTINTFKDRLDKFFVFYFRFIYLHFQFNLAL